MSDNERTGWRDQAYSTWHRNLPWHLGLIDLDGVEYCKAPYCGKIVAIYELCADLTREDKDHRLTLQLAKRADVRAYVVLYQPRGKADIEAVRARVIHPYTDSTFTDYAPDEWAAHLKSLRCHEVQPKAATAAAPQALRLVPDREPLWPGGINPYVSPERRAELLASNPSQWCREVAPDETEVCICPPGHDGPHKSLTNVWPRVAA